MRKITNKIKLLIGKVKKDYSNFRYNLGADRRFKEIINQLTN